MAKKEKRTEAEVHFDLYRRLMNLIEPGLEIRGIRFGDVKPEHKVDGGFVDLAVFDNKGKVWCVVEAKRYEGKKINRHIDPNSPTVVKQAAGYAIQLGAPYFATYNGLQATLFKTAEKFVPLTQRKGKPYDVKDTGKDKFARQLLEDLVALERKAIAWAPLDEQFIARLRSLHHYIYIPLLESLQKKLEASAKFRGTYKKWVEEQGFDFDDPLTHEYIAAEGAYLLVNKLVFYKFLERKHGTKLLRPLRPPRDISQFAKTIRERFDEVLEIDYRAIFNRDRIFDEIPITSSVAESLNEFLTEIEDYDVEALSSDVIGRVYENLIPPEERHDLGQYYTPPSICELIVKHTVDSADQLVMDPGCGSGGFLVQAYDRLAKLAGKETKHTKLLRQIWGIDVNRFPAHLAAINMTLKEIGAESDEIRIFVGDFFDVEPKGQITLPWLADPRTAIRQADLDEAEGKELGEHFPRAFDAIVANPPYIRQEQIPNKKKVRKHLARRERDFSSRSDIYVYFFTHATEFLKQGGRLGFIVSNRWLFTDYGEDLQKFFLKNYLLEAVILLQRQQFKIPLIGTCLVFLKKLADSYQEPQDTRWKLKFEMEAAEQRGQNVVKFVRLHGQVSVDELLRIVETETFEPNTLVERSDCSIYCISQKELDEEAKWTKYFAPKVVFDLVGNPKMVRLEEVCDTEFGIKSGANSFFYMTGEEAASRGVKRRFLRPLMKSIGQANYIEFTKEDTEWFVLDLHKYVTSAITKGRLDKEGRALEVAIKNFWEREGYEDLVAYLNQGEADGLPRLATVKQRPIWFDLGELTIAPLMYPAEYWKRWFVLTNPDRIALDHHVYPLIPKVKVKTEVIGGIMNSCLVPLMREIYGREASGEALNRNECMVSETKRLPIVDPRKITEEDREDIAAAFNELVRKERIADEVELRRLKRKLDVAVLKSIGMAGRVDEVVAAVEDYLRRRIEGGGIRKRVLVY